MGASRNSYSAGIAWRDASATTFVRLLLRKGPAATAIAPARSATRSRKGGFNLAFGGDVYNTNLLPERTRCRLHLLYLRRSSREHGVNKHTNQGGAWNQLMQHLQALFLQFVAEDGCSSEIASWPVQACDVSVLNWIATHRCDDWNGRRR